MPRFIRKSTSRSPPASPIKYFISDPKPPPQLQQYSALECPSFILRAPPRYRKPGSAGYAFLGPIGQRPCPAHNTEMEEILSGE